MTNFRQFTRSKSSFSSSSSSSLLILFSYTSQNFIHKLFFLICCITISLSLFSFFLQWRARPENDPITRLLFNGSNLPGFIDFTNPTRVFSTSDGFPMNLLGQSYSPVFPYFRGWNFNYNDSHLLPKICMTTTTSAGIEQLLPWIFYHKVIGFSNFFIFVEGKAANPNVSKVLQSIPGVQAIHRTKELEDEQAKSPLWNLTWMSSFFSKPCNYKLFVKQSFNMETAIVRARNAGMDWIFHLDTDELLHPAGSKDYSIKDILKRIPQDIDTVVFTNYENIVERDDIRDPFSEISMFKKSLEDISKEIYVKYYEEARHGNPLYFMGYGNGKSAARIQDHLRSDGSHRWNNFHKQIKEVKMKDAVVLHYTYSRFSDLVTRRDRCHCKPTKEDIEKCFMMQFDRNAFLVSSVGTHEEMRQWYSKHVVWNDEVLKRKLMKSGMFTHIYAPMIIIRALREFGVFTAAIASA